MGMAREMASSARRWQRTMHERHLRSFVFIHINKTGGSSIEHALGLRLDHSTAREKFAELGADAWEKKFTFTIVRNPWDKVVSHYHWRVKTERAGDPGNELSFPEWVRACFEEKDPVYRDDERMFMPQRQWLVGNDDQVIVEFVGHFENLANDFDVICNRLGRQAELGHAKRTSRKPYQTYYDDATRALIEQVYAEDIDEFNYSF